MVPAIKITAKTAKKIENAYAKTSVVFSAKNPQITIRQAARMRILIQKSCVDTKTQCQKVFSFGIGGVFMPYFYFLRFNSN